MVGEFCWQVGWLVIVQVGGWVFVYCQQCFFQDDNGLLFFCEWLKCQEFLLFVEYGVGYWQGELVYVLELDELIELLGMVWVLLWQFMLYGDFDQFCMFGYVSQIGIWVCYNWFCGNCGICMQVQDYEWVMQCLQCGLYWYLCLLLSMIVLVIWGDEVLLVCLLCFVLGVYSILVGFVEVGELVEQCVVCEVCEEVGVEVVNFEYIGSQNWLFLYLLMFGFYVEYVFGEIVLQEDEIEDVQWFFFDVLLLLLVQCLIVWYLIDLYLVCCLGVVELVLLGQLCGQCQDYQDEYWVNEFCFVVDGSVCVEIGVDYQ